MTKIRSGTNGGLRDFTLMDYAHAVVLWHQSDSGIYSRNGELFNSGFLIRNLRSLYTGDTLALRLPYNGPTLTSWLFTLNCSFAIALAAFSRWTNFRS